MCRTFAHEQKEAKFYLATPLKLYKGHIIFRVGINRQESTEKSYNFF